MILQSMLTEMIESDYTDDNEYYAIAGYGMIQVSSARTCCIIIISRLEPLNPFFIQVLPPVVY